MNRSVVIVAAVRTPWCHRGGALASLGAGELGASAVREVLLTAGIRPREVDALVLGVGAPPSTAGDLAREVGLRAELTCSAHAVSMGAISGERAICTAVDAIAMGRAEVVVAAGVETPSDVAVSMTRPLREAITEARRAGGMSEKLRALSRIDPGDLKLSFPRESDPVAGMSPVAGAEILAKRFDLSRPQQDAFAARSHACALDAARRGRRGGVVVPVAVPGSLSVEITEMDDGPRADASVRRLSTLPTLRVPDDAQVVTERLATVTAGNSTFEADGAGALLLTSQARAAERGWTVLAHVHDHRFSAVDPLERPLLGAVDALRSLLDANARRVEEVAVLELGEGFASSTMAVIRSLGLPEDVVNANGGGIAFGHPAGASGFRLVATAIERMHDEHASWAAVAGSGDGGQGCALLLESRAIPS